jgi:ketosteroid isomerase-like protein
MEKQEDPHLALAAIERFNSAFNRHDVDAVMEAMTEDCV